jgi:hypothetical protein
MAPAFAENSSNTRIVVADGGGCNAQSIMTMMPVGSPSASTVRSAARSM